MEIFIGLCLQAVWTPPHNSVQAILYQSVFISVSGSVNTPLQVENMKSGLCFRMLIILNWKNTIFSLGSITKKDNQYEEKLRPK